MIFNHTETTPTQTSDPAAVTETCAHAWCGSASRKPLSCATAVTSLWNGALQGIGPAVSFGHGLLWWHPRSWNHCSLGGIHLESIYIYIYTYMNLSNSMILGTPTCRKRWETSYPKRHTHWSHLRVEVVCGDSEARMLPAICHWLDARDEPFRSGLCGYPHVSFGAKERWPFTPFTSLSCRHESVTFLGSPIWPTSPAVESIGWNFWQVSTWAQLNWTNFFESNGSTWITCRAAPSGCVPETHVPPQQIRKPKAVDIPHEDTTSLAA